MEEFHNTNSKFCQVLWKMQFVFTNKFASNKIYLRIITLLVQEFVKLFVEAKLIVKKSQITIF